MDTISINGSVTFSRHGDSWIYVNESGNFGMEIRQDGKHYDLYVNGVPEETDTDLLTVVNRSRFFTRAVALIQ